MAGFALTYQDYASSHPGDASGGSEGGQGTSSLIPEDQWNNLSDAQKWNDVGGGIALWPSDPRYADLAKQLGVTSGSPIMGTYGGTGYKDGTLVDPNKLVKQGDLTFISNDNLTPQAQVSSGVPDWFWPVAFIAGVAGGTALGGAAAGSAGGAIPGASAALESGGIVTAGDIAAGTSAGLSTGAAGAAGAAGVEGAAAVPGAAGDESAGLSMTPPGSAPPVEAPPPVDESAGLNMTPAGTSPPPVDAPAPGVTPAGQDLAPPLDTTPAAGTPSANTIGGLGPDELPPGSAGNASLDASGGVTPASSATPTGGGLINNASDGWQSISNWYSHLSPASRFILGQAVSTGARGAITGISQHEANQAAIDAENRHRQDVIRQHQVPVLPPGTFTYHPPGG